MAPSSTHLSPAELSYLHTSLLASPPIRPDARNATDFRPFSAETGLLPNTMGSAHVGFADGREAVVGVRAEVERTVQPFTRGDDTQDINTTSRNTDVDMSDINPAQPSQTQARLKGQGKASWISLSLTLPTLRDDDTNTIFLEEMLRESLTSPTLSMNNTSLQDALVINSRWHWHLYVDVVLISSPEHGTERLTSSYPLPLLSMAIHIALRDTRIPKLKSEGDEDPLADDDWGSSESLFAQNGYEDGKRGLCSGLPPVTLLVIVVGENVVFDPTGRELAVADAVLAVSVCAASNHPQVVTGNMDGGDTKKVGSQEDAVRLVTVRMLQAGARDTMRGTTRSNVESWADVPGCWKPKVGGVKRHMISKVVKMSMEEVGRDVFGSLNTFMTQNG